MAKRIRLIARLDVKSENIIKGIHLEGLRIIGSPSVFAKKYYLQGADELIFMDTVASLYGRNHLGHIIKSVAKDVFVPITVGGGIRSVEDALEILRLGADKVAINTAAVTRPALISEIANSLGSQAMVLSVEAKKVGINQWEDYTDNGRESTGVNVMEWLSKAQNLGAGEILLTSVDREGTKKGFDIDLIQAACKASSLPLIVSGGMGKYEHLKDAVLKGQADAIAMAGVLHYKELTFFDIRSYCGSDRILVRNHEQ